MEKFPQNQHEVNIDQLKEYARHVADMYIQTAELYLEEGDPLRSRVVDYYSARPETEQELLNVLGKKNEGEIADYIQALKSFTEDPSRFIERMEKLYELQDVHKRRREIASQDRLATAEEYELGAYADVLESHVRDAVLAARKKGYLTFQSGFREKNERDQFVDFYNKNIVIPEETLKYLREQSIEIKIENFDDRTTLTLHPTGTNPIRLTQWKQIWDTLVESLPLADSETVSDMKLTEEHTDFRRKQDSLRNQG
jgi:hypothetical protein